ncbi:zinc ABC transporter substrate-binding protein [Paenalkalicoccus suaedae]|uniref:Zinc ABC transporter substrate-binding protein n=1 Tax=Paenalkalicoccus suaedae TaxID=2592382 RepID=A0A859FE37_9BACI|nr:zinc ABC transporter substrate-binding protein [Paenalkalicoccus suaedae]QKS70982.1 zinc ABC transporter substrate-binding protein [Paenalkalicoccus suaedae]
MQRKSYLMHTLIASALLLAACGSNNEAEDMNSADESNTENTNTANEVNNEPADADALNITTTLFYLEDFTNRIGGEYVNVENLVPVGADAHTFEPTANQMIGIAEADLFLYNGAEFEGFADSVIDAVSSQGVMIQEATEGLELIGYSHGVSLSQESNDEHNHDHEDEHNHSHNDEHNHDHEDEHNHSHNDEHNHDHDDEHNHSHNDEHNHDHDDEHNHSHNDEHNHDHEDVHNHSHNDDHDHEGGHDHAHGDFDPHVWLDPVRSIEVAESIKNTLVELLPEAEETFTANFEELQTDLEALDADFNEMIEAVDNSTIIVSHAGYGYWQDRYGIQQVGITGLSPTNEPSIQQVESVIAYMEENDVNYVMFEQNIPTNIAETVREQVGAEQLWLHNLENLTEEDVENGEDYVSLMQRNIETLQTGLQ